mmetsp:Transcript_114740/g.325016  ORF Transcript_114740/g.325016 Transcript_114740/m.325016 type:complete len:231 (+) Transcript_114740:248-940(+)
MAFAFAASSRLCSYFSMMYMLLGIVPSVGEAFPTLMGSVFPTSHRRAMLVMARSSTNSSLPRGRLGSETSSNLPSPLSHCALTNLSAFPIVAQTSLIASLGFIFLKTTLWVTRVKNSPPTSASELRWVNISCLEAVAARSSSRNTPNSGPERSDMAFDIPPSCAVGVPLPTCCSVCFVCVHSHAPHRPPTRAFHTGISASKSTRFRFRAFLYLNAEVSLKNSSMSRLYSP